MKFEVKIDKSKNSSKQTLNQRVLTRTNIPGPSYRKPQSVDPQFRNPFLYCHSVSRADNRKPPGEPGAPAFQRNSSLCRSLPEQYPDHPDKIGWEKGLARLQTKCTCPNITLQGLMSAESCSHSLFTT